MNQTLFAEVVESETNHTEAPCSYIIDYGAEILLPSEVHIHGTRSYLHGIMTGVHDLYVEDEAFLTVTSTAQTALLERQEYIQMTSEGNFSVPRLYVKRGGHIDFSRISQDIVVDVAFLEIKYQGLFEMNHGYIDSDHADLESEGVLSLDGRGHSGSTGVGAGIREGTGYGTGASYGGVGGWMSSSSLAPTYGSVYNPHHLGSGGGSSIYGAGGSGGSSLHWEVGKLIHINGLITSCGMSGATSAGAGSGGSILLHAVNTTGHGEIRSSGWERNRTGCRWCRW